MRYTVSRWAILAGALVAALAPALVAAQAQSPDFTNITNLAMWSALVAMAVPWVAASINRTDASSFVKWAVFASVCVVAAAGTSFFEGNLRLDGENFIRSLLIVVTLAGVYYRLWMPAVKEVEHKTG